MAQVINTNIASINAQRNLNESQSSLNTSLERLSTGLRINSAKDDAAGLAIAERFTTQIRGLEQAQRNANDGISFAQTAEGALGTIGDALQRIRELAVQSGNDTNSASDRQALNDEVQQLIAEVGRVAGSTEFNGQKILDGSLEDLVFQVGANQNQTISVDGVDGRASQLGAGVFAGNSISLSDFASGADSNGFPSVDAADLTDVSVNGVEVDLSSAESLDDAVAAINAVVGETGVQASRSTEVSTDEIAFVAPDTGETGTISINGVDIGVDDGDTNASVIEKINDRSAQTGVTATLEDLDGDSTSGIVLSSSADIEVEVADEGTTLDFGGLTAAGTSQEVYARGIDLNSEVGEETTVTGADITNLQFDTDFAGNSIATVDFALNNVDISTRESSTEALKTLDFALQQANGLRAELGAVQTRFESTIDNLSVTSENLTASRSRIQDADFAAETANLTRAQILQQAGTSVLAQANAIPQNVLSLLG